MKKKFISLMLLIILIGCSKVKIDTIYSKEHNFYAKFPAGYSFNKSNKTSPSGVEFTESMWSAVVNGCEYTLTVSDWPFDFDDETNQKLSEGTAQTLLLTLGGELMKDEKIILNNHWWRYVVIKNDKGFINTNYTTLWAKKTIVGNKQYSLMMFISNDLSVDNMLIWDSIHFIENN